ncbi:MAG: hypothetical protein AB7G15_01935 [Alphaproteobacteria bacterium]
MTNFVAWKSMARAPLAAMALALALTGAAQAQQQNDPLKAVNDGFRGAYKQARAETLKQLSPVFIVQFDSLIVHRNGARTETTFTPKAYHEYKSFAHIPLTVFVMLQPGSAQPLTDAKLKELETYRALVANADKGIDGLGWPTDAVQLHRNIASRAMAFIDERLKTKSVTPQVLTRFARQMAPLALASADFAARAQLDGLHALVTKQRREMGEAEWRRLLVVNLAPRQARPGNLQFAYFKRAMGAGAEGKRLFNAENVFTEDGALNLLGTIVLDKAASVAFFNDPARLERDLLSDAAAAHVVRIFQLRQ